MTMIINITVSNLHFAGKFNYLWDSENNCLVLEQNQVFETSLYCFIYLETKKE